MPAPFPWHPACHKRTDLGMTPLRKIYINSREVWFGYSFIQEALPGRNFTRSRQTVHAAERKSEIVCCRAHGAGGSTGEKQNKLDRPLFASTPALNDPGAVDGFLLGNSLCTANGRGYLAKLHIRALLATWRRTTTFVSQPC